MGLPGQLLGEALLLAARQRRCLVYDTRDDPPCSVLTASRGLGRLDRRTFKFPPRTNFLYTPPLLDKHTRTTTP